MNAEPLPLITIQEAKECAELMSETDPWITLSRSYEDCLKLFLDRSKNTFVVKEHEKVIAFCVIHTNNFPQPYIKSLAVHRDYRGRGIARKLLDWAEKTYGHINGKMFIAVSSFNTKAKDLYRHAGYVKVGELKNYIIDGHSEVLFEKIIGSTKNSNSEKDNAYVSADLREMDIDFIFTNLKSLYWATGITRENLIGRMMNSLCFGVFVNNGQIGFARVVTDYFSFAYLADVFVEEKQRGKGYSRLLMEYILDYPSLRDIKWLLATRDMHDLYRKFGFNEVVNPERFMGKNGWKPHPATTN